MSNEKLARLEAIQLKHDEEAKEDQQGFIDTWLTCAEGEWLLSELREAWTQQEIAEGASSAKGAALKASLEFGSKLREEVAEKTEAIHRKNETIADYREALKYISTHSWSVKSASQDKWLNEFVDVADKALAKCDRTRTE